MSWCRAVAIDLVTVGAACGAGVVVLRPFLVQRETLAWPAVAAIVTGHDQGPGFKGRSATYLIGQYDTGGGGHEFRVVWGDSELGKTADGSNAWVPPPSTPPIGASLKVHFDPHLPSRVALESGPSVPSTFKTFATLGVVLFLVVMIGVSVWFT